MTFFGLTSRRSQPPLALSVPLSRFTPLVGGGSAFYVRPHHTFMKNTTISLILVLFTSACSHKTESTPTTSTGGSTPQFSIAASDVSSASVEILTNTPNLVAAHKTASADVHLSSKAAADFQKFTQE